MKPIIANIHVLIIANIHVLIIANIHVHVPTIIEYCVVKYEEAQNYVTL